MACVLIGGGILVCNEKWAAKLFGFVSEDAFRFKTKRDAIKAAKAAKKILFDE